MKYSIVILDQNRKYLGKLMYPFIPSEGDIIILDSNEMVEVLLRILPTTAGEDFTLITKHTVV